MISHSPCSEQLRHVVPVRLRDIDRKGNPLSFSYEAVLGSPVLPRSVGLVKTVGTLRKTRHRGTPKACWVFEFTIEAYNLVRICNIALYGQI